MSLFENVKSVVAKAVTRFVKKYDQNWFVNFMNIARSEDMDSGGGVSDPMRQHAWVNIAIMTIARNFARAEFELFSGDDLVETGPEYELFQNVNPYMSRYQLWEATVSWLQNIGEAIWIYNREYGVGLPKEIYPVDPGNFKHYLSKDGREITIWKYVPKDATTSEGIPFTTDELLHFRLWNKWDAWRGVNPATSIGYEVRQDYLANKSNINLLNHGSTPDGIITTEEAIDEDEANRMKTKWIQEHSGVNRAHTVAIMGHGVKYQPIQLSNADMQYFEMKKWNRQTILAKYNVPPGVVGVKDDTSPLSGTDLKEQMKMFWSMCLIPIQRLIIDKLRTDFFTKTGSKLTAHFSTDGIAELQEDEGVRIERAIKGVEKGILTQNEGREMIDKDPVPWGDTWWKPMMLSDVQGATTGVPDEPTAEPKVYTIASSYFTRQKVYTAEYKTAHWWKVTNEAEEIEKRFLEELKDFFFKQRTRALEVIVEESKTDKALDRETYDRIFDDILNTEWWEQQRGELKEIIARNGELAVVATGQQLSALFEDLGIIEFGKSFDIYNTRAIELLANRVNRGSLSKITDNVREKIKKALRTGISEGMSEKQIAEQIRSVYTGVQANSATIARTELGGVMNDSRIESFKELGIKKHSWLSARDGKVRTPDENNIFDHVSPESQGPIEVGAKFNTGGAGLKYPNDPEGEAGNVINCRCLTIPEVE